MKIFNFKFIFGMLWALWGMFSILGSFCLDGANIYFVIFYVISTLLYLATADYVSDTYFK